MTECVADFGDVEKATNGPRQNEFLSPLRSTSFRERHFVSRQFIRQNRVQRPTQGPEMVDGLFYYSTEVCGYSDST